ncbi:MAG: V-type ATP synthase subunit E [Ruminococcus sp.]|nr:V-type ATP synthase subunit E [Ruminococcus sp.]
MSGLENIKASIDESAKSECESISREAKRKADAIKKAGDENAQKAYDEQLKKSEDKLTSEYENALSAADSQMSRAVLKRKNELIKKARELAYEKLLKLDDEQYFSLLLEIARTLEFSADAEVRLNERDLKRMPKDFEKKLNECSNTGGYKIKVSDVTAEIDGGFIVVYGRIVDDCSIAALMEAKSGDITLAASEALFD